MRLDINKKLTHPVHDHYLLILCMMDSLPENV